MILKSDDVKQSLAKQGVDPMLMAPAAFGAFMTAEIEKWGKVVRAANIKLE